MNAPNFASVLDMAPTDVERPKPLPQGTYLCVVAGMPKFDKSTKKGTDYCEFTYNILGLGPDLEEDDDAKAAIEEMGGIQGKTIRDTYYLTESSVYRLKEMLQNCGLDESEYKSLRQMIESAPNSQLYVHIKHQPSQDGTQVYANVAKTAPVEA